MFRVCENPYEASRGLSSNVLCSSPSAHDGPYTSHEKGLKRKRPTVVVVVVIVVAVGVSASPSVLSFLAWVSSRGGGGVAGGFRWTRIDRGCLRCQSACETKSNLFSYGSSSLSACNSDSNFAKPPTPKHGIPNHRNL